MELIPDLGPPNVFDGIGRFSTYAHMKVEFERLGCEVSRLGDLLWARKDGRNCYLRESDTSFTSHLVAKLLKDKRLTNQILRLNGLSVAEQHVFDRGDRAGARDLVARLGSAVVKPTDGNQGRGVTVGVTLDSFDVAWDAACEETERQILVESYFGDALEARYLVVDGRCVAVHRSIPPHVIGDGKASVAELIDRRNALRKRNPSTFKEPILIDANRIGILAGQGLTLRSVPAAGRTVLIDSKAGISTGGESMNITDSAHPGMKRLMERLARIAPGMDVIGVDVLAHDHAQAPEPGNYIVVEANTRPGLSSHLYPTYGKPINVCRIIAESCLRKMEALPKVEAEVEA